MFGPQKETGPPLAQTRKELGEEKHTVFCKSLISCMLFLSVAGALAGDLRQ